MSFGAFASELLVPEGGIAVGARAAVSSGSVAWLEVCGFCGRWMFSVSRLRIVNIIALWVVEARDPPFSFLPTDGGLCCEAVVEGAALACRGVGVAVALPLTRDRREVLVVRAAV